MVFKIDFTCDKNFRGYHMINGFRWVETANYSIEWIFHSSISLHILSQTYLKQAIWKIFQKKKKKRNIKIDSTIHVI